MTTQRINKPSIAGRATQDANGAESRSAAREHTGRQASVRACVRLGVSEVERDKCVLQRHAWEYAARHSAGRDTY